MAGLLGRWRTLAAGELVDDDLDPLVLIGDVVEGAALAAAQRLEQVVHLPEAVVAKTQPSRRQPQTEADHAVGDRDVGLLPAAVRVGHADAEPARPVAAA